MSQPPISFEEFYYHKIDMLHERWRVEMYEYPPKWLEDLAKASLKEGEVLDDDTWARFYAAWSDPRVTDPSDCPGWDEWCTEQYHSYYYYSDALYNAWKDSQLGKE